LNYSNPLLNSTSYSQSVSNRNYYNANYSGLTGRLNMLAGDSYYMEVYHINVGGPGNFIVSVEVPNINTNLLNQVFEVDQIYTNVTADP
jgi:hypothetical protein